MADPVASTFTAGQAHIDAQTATQMNTKGPVAAPQAANKSPGGLTAEGIKEINSKPLYADKVRQPKGKGPRY